MYLNYKSFRLILIFLFALSALLTAADSYALKPFYRVNHSWGYTFKTVIAPDTVKFHKLKFTLFIAKNGKPVKNFRGKISLSMPGMYMGKNIATIRPVNGAPGKYTTYIYFTMGGLWKIDYILFNANGKLLRFFNELNVN